MNTSPTPNDNDANTAANGGAENGGEAAAPAAIILAAGKGTRMDSDLPKVAHEVAGEPMVRWVARAAAAAGCTKLVVVVGYEAGTVRACLDGFDRIFPAVEIEFVNQDEQLGTGHAVSMAAPALETERSAPGSPVFVLAGDGPLVRATTLEKLLDTHRSADGGSGAAATIATATIDDPTGYGRIVRDGSGAFRCIVEQKNASDEQKQIKEVNPSYYCFDARALFDMLPTVRRDEASGEYYLTDVPEMLLKAGRTVEVVDAVPREDVLSINTPEQLAEVDRILRERVESEPAARVGGV
jgi:UDP-N-acetylglucosamine diphosphorylase/glucosamine-1-phosphate N-acetyltransferase